MVGPFRFGTLLMRCWPWALSKAWRGIAEAGAGGKLFLDPGRVEPKHAGPEVNRATIQQECAGAPLFIDRFCEGSPLRRRVNDRLAEDAGRE
jgi:hypothetical protein